MEELTVTLRVGDTAPDAEAKTTQFAQRNVKVIGLSVDPSTYGAGKSSSPISA